MLPNDSASLRTYILSRVDRSGECWVWQRARSADGYAHMRHQGKVTIVSRLAYELWRGPIPAGLHVLHDCPGGDNPACVNPAHLWLGTHGDNMRDREAKGRSNRARGAANGANTHPERLRRGVSHPHSRFTEADIPEIRAARRRGNKLREIAEHYGVSIQAIHAIVQGRLWQHVPDQGAEPRR